MEIRKLAIEEHPCTRGLYEEVFPEDSKSFVDYYYTEKTKDNQIYVIEEDGAVQAMLHLNPYQIMAGAEEKTAHYIVAVATRKEYRKRGYMALLLKRALADMQKAGEAFTFLMPAAEAIYEPHGFRTVYEQDGKVYRGGLPGEGRAHAAWEDGKPFQVTELKEEECEETALAAEAYLAEHYQVYARRTAQYYSRLKKECESDGGKLVVFRRDGAIADCRLCVRPGEAAPKEKPKIMVRAVDVRRLLMSMRLKELTAFCITVTDPIIEENNRCLVVTGTEYSGVMLMDGKEENSEGNITVAALTSFLFGARSVEEICLEEGVELSPRLREELKKIVPLSKIYLNEAV